MSWKTVKLGDILTESKIESEKPNPDKRITVRLNVKGVEKRPFEVGVEGGTKYYVRKAGQFIYGKQNLFKGAFGIVPLELDGFESSQDIPAFDVSNDCLPEWIFYYLKQNDFYKILESLATGTGSRRIQPSRLFEVEIPLPDVQEQRSTIANILRQERKFDNLFKEINEQQSYLQLLRQTVLQEAVQGKLTKQDTNDEPASELLKKIKAEKQKLIKEGKLKKEKELPPIIEDEVPFNLPNGWVWCRLGDLCIKIGSGSTPKGGKEVYKEKGIKFIRSQNVYNEGLFFENIAYIDEATHKKMSGTKVISNDLLLNITGGSIGRCALVPLDFDEANVNQHVTIIRTVSIIEREFIHQIIISPYFQDYIMSTQTGGNREGLAKKNMELMLVPLPPMAEQQRTVAKVEQIQQQLKSLETQVQQSHLYTSQLLHTVIKEAFERDPIDSRP